eukprot:365463-Chlamydomonas_euryale.AAC.3
MDARGRRPLQQRGRARAHVHGGCNAMANLASARTRAVLAPWPCFRGHAHGGCKVIATQKLTLLLRVSHSMRHAPCAP